MFNDETQEDVTLENNIEDNQEEVDAEESADETNWESEAKKWRAIAERKAKKLESPAPKQPKAESNGTLTEDDILVITTIQDKELINTAREIAKLKGVTLAEAAESTMFKLAKAEREDNIRQEKVSMEASRGSANRGKKKDFKTSGLSPAEHKELWKSRTGR